ncbi:MAG: GGDEF domain-containing protein [Rhizobiaceae bacterium]|nr:GGDEF domain-containing protein [Rhizobiaceae bacterium]MCV0405494.1 GGDEF domain-containing protein [Rhizobiaceae bacterium]
MRPNKFNLWLTSQYRVALLTALGTLFCIAVALVVDGYSIEEGRWRWGANPWNNVIIPLLVAPPLLYFLLTQMRRLSIAHRRLEIVASTDSLTSCLNRAAFATLVEAYLEKFADPPRHNQGAMLVIDVDHFKRINDTFGHDVGDDALKLIADSIREALRDVDLIGRLGGEEFCVFLPGATSEQCEGVAGRICRAVEDASFCPSGQRWPISVSIGAVPFAKTTTFSELYRVADQHLYEAKRSGRNKVVVSRPMGAENFSLN